MCKASGLSALAKVYAGCQTFRHSLQHAEGEGCKKRQSTVLPHMGGLVTIHGLLLTS